LKIINYLFDNLPLCIINGCYSKNIDKLIDTPKPGKRIGIFVLDLKVNMDIFVNIVSTKSRDCTDSFFFLVFQRHEWKSIDRTDPKC
jgi:hypothetical protein